MKNINDNVFLNKIGQRIKLGDFDVYLTIPFMTRDLLFFSIKGKLEKKISTGGTPILNDIEIKECLLDVKDTAVNIIKCYIKLGFMEKTEEGFIFTKKFDLAKKAAYKL